MDGDVKARGKIDEDDVLKEARARFKLAVDVEAENRSDALDDLKFLSGEQWSADAKKLRAGRPCLTINRLPNFIRSVVNEQRKTRPAIDVIPADGSASKETADVIQGLIRHIERDSRAQIAYDTAYKYAVSCGFGHWKVCTDYVDEESFNQKIKIDRISNPFTVYRDPSSNQPDHSDDEFTFITELVDRKTFKAKHGFDASNLEDVGTGDEFSIWYEADKVRVAEYWRVVTEESEIHALPDGQVITGKLDKAKKSELAALGINESMIRTRGVEVRTVEQYLMTCDRLIKKSEWKGKYIPVVTVIGDELNLEGETKLESLTRFAKDPARMYNYLASAETELVAMQPKAPWIAPAGSFDSYEDRWARANTESVAYLEYNPINGQPPPQRQFFAAVPMGVREGRMAAAEDIKAVTGLYDASLGQRSNETSGVAIRAREEQGDNATYHFVANQALAIEFTGKIIIDLAPHIYDTARAVAIITPTNEQQTVLINQTFIDPSGQEKQYNFTEGRYAVAVRVGPSFESKRQEMAQSIVEMAQANPMLLEVAGDLVVKAMDWPQSEEIAERIQQKMQAAQNPPPNPEKELMQQQMQLEGQKAQALLQKAQMEGQIKRDEAQAKMQLGQFEAQNDAHKSQAELEIKRLEVQIKQIDLAIKQAEAETKGIEAQVRMMDAQGASEERQMRQAMHQMPNGEMMPGAEHEEKPEKPDGSIVLASALQGFQSALEGMRAPRKVVRGADGRVEGIE